MNPENLVIFAVGLTEKSDEYTKKLAEVNQTGDAKLFYIRGGVKFSKLGFFERAILKKSPVFQKTLIIPAKKTLQNC